MHSIHTFQFLTLYSRYIFQMKHKNPLKKVAFRHILILRQLLNMKQIRNNVSFYIISLKLNSTRANFT